ncbi:hypothetical protein COCCADRAFT_107209 [Bipolaris zeicola 26-R-13]|uniref:Phosphoribosylaminoimidazole-succinocarboxamide synthase n=1 Tax=Cochliobolus carbonum (strain 26-R-13) TaxID=930089 RepID=W6Y2C9_COCC2|nr:uncharacterized protein COCCADRAFT_107209 [Bipolaris zeicola 26-R-13]EUC29189.1 hypothetical protein COCCADRAFT_107209 [Bipolaris zeicola 26-R-13]
MSGEPGFQLKQTNVSQPQLSHQNSQQSVAASLTASEGYYSASEHASSSSEERRPVYQTPPSYRQTPAQSHEQLIPHTNIPTTSLRGVGIPRQQLQPPQPSFVHERPQSPAVSTIAEESRPGTQNARRSQLIHDMETESQATTPGHDTTPYIRFAIDQLTRDEDVRGSRIYPEVRPPVAVQDDDDDDYPVERIIPDNGLGYMALEQQTQERMQQHKPARKSLRHSYTPLATAPAPMATQPDGPHHKSHKYREQQSPSPTRGQKDVFVAHSQPHSSLHFLPAVLRPLSLGLFIFLCLLMLGALIFAAVYSNRDEAYGLWDYGGFGDTRYFVFRYLPTLLGMLLFLWLIQIQAALQRIVPFISMSSDSFHRRSEAVFLQLYPMQFVLPNIQHFRAGHPGICAFFVISWLFAWTVPLLASSFNVRYNVVRSAWRWVAVQGVIWTVVVLYILLVLVLIYLMVFLMRSPTGLKWDPRSLADIIALLERSNNLGDYNNSETFDKGDWNNVANRADRLGYWTTTKRPSDVFYGIGEEGAEIRRFQVEEGRIREQGPDRANLDVAQGNDFSIRMDIRSPNVRLRYLPWWLKDGSVIAWIVIACILLIAFYVVSFVNDAVRLGFLPRVFARTGTDGFSASNFLYSFVPAVIGQFLFLALLSLDYSIRVLQPYMALASKGGATAETSLLVDYACRLPFSVTLAALENKHFQTAVLSFVSFASMSLPILAGGCFWTQYYGDVRNVRVAAELPGYYALCFFLALYTISLFALIPGRRRAALPHRSNTLCEIISWVYQSPILTDRAFAHPQTKPDLVARLMGTTYAERTWARSVASLVRPSRSNLRPDSPTDPALKEKARKDGQHDSLVDPGKIRYGFGIHVGRDGLEHLGIDRVRRGGDRSGRELVIWEEQQHDHKRKSWNSQV